MFKHYIKIALRNLRKYALQNTVSILGLALGFVALSLSAYWYRFETSYDKFHKDWERIFLVSDYLDSQSSIEEGTIKTLSEMSETESVVNCYRVLSNVLAIGPEFFNTMGYEIIKGDTSFLEKPDYCAISESFARKYYGKKDPIGENIFLLDLDLERQPWEGRVKSEINYCHNNTSSNCIVGAVYRGYNHSYLDYDIMVNAPKLFETDTYLGPSNMLSMERGIKSYFEQKRITFVKLRPGVDSKDYKEKAILIDSQGKDIASRIELCNISKLHSLYDAGPMDVKQLRVFALISMMLVICALVNCITLFVSRISGRRKEMGLRLSNGSSFSGIISLLSIEMILQFLIALLVAVCLVFFIKDRFSEYAQIDVDTMHILWNCLMIMVSVLLMFVVVGIVTLTIVLKGSLSSTMVLNRSLNKIIRRGGLSIQLFICITCLFCSISMLHQFSFLKKSYWGFGTRGVVAITHSIYLITLDENNDSNTSDNPKERQKELFYKLSDRIKQIPGVIEANVTDRSFADYATLGFDMSTSPNNEGEKISVIDLMIYDVGNEAYGFSVIEGSLPEKGLAPDEMVITESACRALGLKNPIGEKLYYSVSSSGFTIVAVISDLYINGPFVAPVPIVFLPDSPDRRVLRLNNDVLLVRYQNDIRKELSELTDSIFTDPPCIIAYMEDWFAKFLKPAVNLFRLFSIISITCMLISVFGVWSIITLTCQERRREIAVRKVHGAKVRDILSIFAREYGKILLITSAFAFGVGYVVMHQWVQQFQKQAPISWWIYAVVIVGMALLICFTVIERVLSTARENPADVIKSE